MFGKFTAFVFSLMIMVQSTGLGYNDLLQLDELVEHAVFHKEQYGDGLLTFLAKHYGPEKEAHHQNQQDEQDDHQELPFQHHQYPHQFAQVFLVQLLNNRRGLRTGGVEQQKRTSYHYFIADYDSHCKGIFQPPRLA